MQIAVLRVLTVERSWLALRYCSCHLSWLQRQGCQAVYYPQWHLYDLPLGMTDLLVLASWYFALPLDSESLTIFATVGVVPYCSDELSARSARPPWLSMNNVDLRVVELNYALNYFTVGTCSYQLDVISYARAEASISDVLKNPPCQHLGVIYRSYLSASLFEQAPLT